MDSLNEVERKVLTHIKSCVRKGQQFFKAKHIAQDIGDLTSYEVSTNLLRLSTKNIGNIKIVSYARTSSITWKVVKV